MDCLETRGELSFSLFLGLMEEGAVPPADSASRGVSYAYYAL